MGRAVNSLLSVRPGWRVGGMEKFRTPAVVTCD